MRFARHETFHFREGWLTKGLRKLELEGLTDVFQRKDSMEELGIGSNMVKSLRYWMQATSLTKERGAGKKQQCLTNFGEVIYQYDRYLEQEITLWLIHYHLATNKEMATAWYWFFNIFDHKEFDEEMFISELKYYISEADEEIAVGSLKKDFDCLISTYLLSNDITYNPENNMGCPLQELGLVELIDNKRKRYRLTKRNVLNMPSELFLYGIFNYMKETGQDELSIDSLLNDKKSIGQIFVLGFSELIHILEILQAQGHIRVQKTAGLNRVTMLIHSDPLDIIKSYYQSEIGVYENER